MSKIIKAAVAVAVLGAAGYAGATWYVGHRVDGKLDDWAKQAEGHKLVQVASRKFERGFWTSTETVTYRIGCEGVAASPLPADGLTVTVRNVVAHNPLKPGITTEFVYSDEARKELAKLFKNQQPLTIHTSIGLNGELTTDIASPAASVTEDGGTLQWKGLKGTFKYDQDFSYVKSTLDLAGAEVQGPQGERMHFGALRSVSDRVRAPEGVYTGKDTLEWAGASANFTTPEGRAIDFLLGKGGFEGTSEVKGGLLSGKVSGQFDQVVVNQAKLGALSLAYSIDRIDAKAIKAYNDETWVKGWLQCDFAPQGQQARLKTLLTAILAHDPALQMKLALKNAAGEGSYQLDLASHDVAEQDFANPMALIAKVNASLAVQVPQALVKQLIAQLDPENAETSQAQFEFALAQGMERGFVETEGDLVKAKLVLKGGQIEVNGQPKTMADFLQ
ncbi:YdgA family protein [Chitinolyticbacter meiyuanensis]|uniref:YdgA family protein n=1 Tax=Chitinolyticbacter meiyuanensis TaxID=682798 RepID=UPI0016529277|nr:YdgA family protein [Chitinolyticbacter meiyuanensis]